MKNKIRRDYYVVGPKGVFGPYALDEAQNWNLLLSGTVCDRSALTTNQLLRAQKR